MTWGSGGFAGNRLILGSAEADATVDFQNPIDISGTGGTRTFQANDGSADVDGMLSGDFSLDGGSLQFTVIPEPSSIILITLFGLALLGLRRRTNSRG